jgi:hypothetical protein
MLAISFHAIPTGTALRRSGRHARRKSTLSSISTADPTANKTTRSMMIATGKEPRLSKAHNQSTALIDQVHADMRPRWRSIFAQYQAPRRDYGNAVLAGDKHTFCTFGGASWVTTRVGPARWDGGMKKFPYPRMTILVSRYLQEPSLHCLYEDIP